MSALTALGVGISIPLLVEGWGESLAQPPGYEDFMTPPIVPVISRIGVALGTAITLWQIYTLATARD